MKPAIPRAIWTLGFVSLLMDVSSELIHGLLPVFLVTGLGASAFAVGLIEGAAESTALIVKVFSGMISDAWGRRKPLVVVGYSLGAISKPLFAFATGAGFVLAARLIDRIGKGIRGAPRDALIADIVPPELRGASFGLRQALDTVGAFVGPLLGIALMLLWDGNFRAVFAVAIVPGFLCVALLVAGVEDTARPARPVLPVRLLTMRLAALRSLGPAYAWVVVIGGAFALARFSEAFLILRARQAGLPIALAPLVLIVMNAVFAAAAYPFGRLADRVAHVRLLVPGIALLVCADIALAHGGGAAGVWAGIVLWGLHLAVTQGLLAAMVAHTAPPELRGTAFGFFNLASGIALLVASALAGFLWDRYGAASAFDAGAGLGMLALLVILLAVLLRPRAAAPLSPAAGAPAPPGPARASR